MKPLVAPPGSLRAPAVEGCVRFRFADDCRGRAGRAETLAANLVGGLRPDGETSAIGRQLAYTLPGGGSAKALLAWLAVGTIVLFLAAWARELAQSYVQAGVGSRIVYNLGAELFQHLQRLSLRFHGRNSTGDLVRRITANTGCVRDLVFGAFLPTFGSLLSLGMMFGIMWRLNHALSLLALVAAPLLGILVRMFTAPWNTECIARCSSKEI